MADTTHVHNRTNENQAIIDAAKSYGAAEVIELGKGGPIVLSLPGTHGGRDAKSVKPFLDEYLKAPERKKGTAAMTSLDSFIAHVNRHKDKGTVVFAIDDPKFPSLLAVYDYNHGGEKGEPRFGQHRASYSFPLSDEWQAWMRAGACEAMTQEDFAELIEDRIGDVMKPEEGGDMIKEFAVNLGVELAGPQRLMTLSRGLKVNVSSKVTNATNLSSGEGQLQFTEEHKTEGGDTLRVPGGFALAIPVFRLGNPWQVPVRLRYRVKGPVVTWTVGLHRTDLTFATAFKQAVETTAADTGLPLFFGKPETT